MSGRIGLYDLQKRQGSMRKARLAPIDQPQFTLNLQFLNRNSDKGPALEFRLNRQPRNQGYAVTHLYKALDSLQRGKLHPHL